MNEANKPKIWKNANSEWFILTPDFKSGKCENPKLPNCGKSDKLLWLKSVKKFGIFPVEKRYICAECVKKDFKLTGLWSNSWEEEFSAEQKEF